MESKTIKTIAVLVAMEAEAEPLVSLLNLAPCPKSHHHAPLPSVVRSGVIDFNNKSGDGEGEEERKCEIVVVTCGNDAVHGVDSVGTVNAALAAYEVLKTHEPDVLVNCGTAGGFKAKGCAIGDVFLVDEVKYHDRRIPIPTFTKYGISAIETWKTPKMREHFHAELKSGVCSTGNSLDATDTDREMMDMLDQSAVSYQVVLTKVDKPKQAELEKVVVETEAELRTHVAAHPIIMQTSAEKGAGIAELRAALAALAAS